MSEHSCGKEKERANALVCGVSVVSDSNEPNVMGMFSILADYMYCKVVINENLITIQ